MFATPLGRSWWTALTWAIQGPSCGESVWLMRSGEIEIEIREVVKVEGVTCTLSVLPDQHFNRRLDESVKLPDQFVS